MKYKKMKKAAILHGWFSDKNSNWYPWLKSEMKKQNFDVFLEDILTMNTEFPDLDEQIKFLEQNLDFSEEFTLVGHSLGALLGMKISERQKIKRLILVAGWDWNDLTKGHQSFWKIPINHQKIKENVSEIICINSTTDPFIGWKIAEEMAERLSAKFVLVENAGHFTKKDGFETFPEILKYI